MHSVVGVKYVEILDNHQWILVFVLLPAEHLSEAASCQHLCQTFQTTGCYCLVQVILWKTSRFSPKHASRAATLVLSTTEAVQSYVSSMEHILYVLVHMAKWQLVAPVKVRGILMADFDVWIMLCVLWVYWVTDDWFWCVNHVVCIELLMTDFDVWHHVCIVGVLSYWWLIFVTILDKIMLKSYTCFSWSWGSSFSTVTRLWVGLVAGTEIFPFSRKQNLV